MAAKSRTAKFYASNAAARKKHNDYQKDFNKQPEQAKKRAELNTYNRKATKAGTNKKGDGKDAIHKGNRIVGFRLASKNRGDSNDSRGDANARSAKRRPGGRKK